MCTSARPWRLRSIGSRSGRAVSSIQMMRPRYCVSPICAAIIAEHAARRAGVAVLLAAAERRVGFVDDDDHRAHRAQHRQHALEVAFGLADVLRPEVLEDHARHADLAADALREKRLAGADRAAQQIAHRQAVERAALEQRRVLAQPRLRRLVADDGVERPLRLDELEQAAALPLEQALLQRPEHRRVEPLAALARRLNQHVEIGERDAGGQLRELRRVEVGEVRRSAPSPVDAWMNVSRSCSSGSGTSIVATCGLPVEAIAQVGQLLVDQHERHVQLLDVRAHRPVEHRHQLGRGLQAEASRLAGGKDVRRLIDDHARGSGDRPPPP